MVNLGAEKSSEVDPTDFRRIPEPEEKLPKRLPEYWKDFYYALAMHQEAHGRKPEVRILE